MTPQEMPIPALAYLGDAVLEVWVRERLVRTYHCGAGRLNRESLAFVSAPAQASALARILPFLSQEETDWMRRGRNMAHRNLPPHATKEQYRDATALEVLFGFLHLSGEAARIGELFLLAYPDGAENPAEKAENGGDARED
ncbi:mini-ribonuclease 3 [Clostridium sp. CAG:448]|nr:mini-ribonuclease 3 [Clostridium sp. CAG:448]